MEQEFVFVLLVLSPYIFMFWVRTLCDICAL